MTHRNYIVIKASGVSDYPFTEANGWYNVLEFQTNSGSTTTFDPTVGATAEVAWDYGDGYYATGASSLAHTYADSSVKTVKMYLKGASRTITLISCAQDNIVGTLDFRNDAFKATANYDFASNLQLTGVLFPSAPIVALTQLNAQVCDLTGSVDLSMFTSLSTSGAYIYFGVNPKLTSVTFPDNPSGKYMGVTLNNTGLVGTADLSMLVNWGTVASLFVYSCPSLTGLTLPSSTTGSMNSLQIYSNPLLEGSLDISAFKNWSASGQFGVYLMPLVTSLITSSSAITGTFSSIQIYSLGISSLDLRKYVSYTTSASIQITANNSLVTLQTPETVSGTFQSLYIYNNPLMAGVLDISKFNSFITTNAYIYLNQNPNMTGVILASSITGTFVQVRIHDTGIVGVLDLRMFTSFSTTQGAYFMAYGNPNVTQILLASSISGNIIPYPYFNNNPLMTSIDLGGLPNGFNSAVNTLTLINGCDLPASIVNKILYDVNSKSVSGFAGRSVSLAGGTNAAPDSTSGGYDGLAAKAALIAKGISVSTN